MNPLKHKLANEWMRQDDATPEEALDTWNTMEAEFKLNRAMSQEPRTMAQEPRNMAQGGRIGFEPGGAVRKSELIKVLGDSGITTSSSNFSKVVKDLGVKVNKTHPLHRKTQPIYIEPTKKKLVIMKKKHTKNQLQSFHTGPGREAYELREKRILELLNEGDKTLSELDATIRKEFGTSSKTTIIKLKNELKIKLPDARVKGPLNVKTAKIIKDLNILKNSEELNNLILKSDFNLMKDLPELEKIATKMLPKTTADPVRRVGQLLLAYSGEDPELQKYVGEVSDDLVKASGVVKTKMNKSSRLLSTLQKIASEKRAAGELGKDPAFFGSQRKRLNEIVNSFKKGLNIEVDEVKAIGGAKAKTPAYNLFIQGVKETVNQKKGETLDRLTQTAELDLQKATTQAEKIKIAETYNKEVKKFVENANKNLKPGQLPVRAFEISFDKPSKTIKNKAAYNKYKSYFDNVHTTHGYSFKVPKDVMTSEQAKIFLKTDKGQAQLLKQTDLGSQRLYSFPANLAESKTLRKVGKGLRKVGAGYELGFIGLDFMNNLDNGMDTDTAFQTALSNATFGMYEGGRRAQWEDFETAGKELGHNPENLNEIKSMLDLEKMLAGEKQTLNDMIAYNAQEGSGVGLQGMFPAEEIEWRKDVVARLEKEFENKQNTFWSKDNAQDLAKNYQDTVGYVARKEYNKNLETGLLDKGRKDRVNPEMGSIGSPLWEVITDWKDYAPQSFLPQNFLQNEITKAIPNTLRKLPGIFGDMWEPTSEQAKLFDMSKEEKEQRAKDLNIQEQSYHPVTGNTMTYGQMEPYYDKYYAEGGIASLMKKK